VVNGENYHVLEALTFTCSGTVDCIYIDPPLQQPRQAVEVQQRLCRGLLFLAGKSRLLGAARELALADGVEVLAARGGELEGAFVFGIVRQLFETPLTIPAVPSTTTSRPSPLRSVEHRVERRRFRLTLEPAVGLQRLDPHASGSSGRRGVRVLIHDSMDPERRRGQSKAAFAPPHSCGSVRC